MPRYTPTTTVASTPDTFSSSAGIYATKGVMSEIRIWLAGSWTCRRIRPITTATTSPYAIPPRTTSASRARPWPSVNGCAIASTASPKAVSATASLIRLSPSKMVTTRCGAPSRVSTDVAATASVGATAAANASAGAQPRPGKTRRVTQPTPMIVAAVAPNASPVIGIAFSRLSRGADRNAAL